MDIQTGLMFLRWTPAQFRVHILQIRLNYRLGQISSLFFHLFNFVLSWDCVPLICAHDSCCQIENGTLSVSDVALPFITWSSILLLPVLFQCNFRTLASCFILGLELPLDLTLKRDPLSLLDHIQSQTGCTERPPDRPPLSRVALTGGREDMIHHFSIFVETSMRLAMPRIINIWSPPLKWGTGHLCGARREGGSPWSWGHEFGILGLWSSMMWEREEGGSPPEQEVHYLRPD